METKSKDKRRVVVVGAGFAGLSAAQVLAKNSTLEILVVDRNNYHTFQPLLYQVAAAELEPGSIANPLRGLCRRRPNVSVAMTEVVGVDFEKKILKTAGPDIDYDFLVLAPGSGPHFFGIPGAAEHSFALKSLEEAVRLRNHLLQCFERAALLPKGTDLSRNGLTQVVVVGGGPTGVEYAGALAELIRSSLSRDFQELPKGFAKLTLLEAGEKILPVFPERLSEYALKRLERMGVPIKLGAQVTEVRPDAVLLADGTEIPCSTVVWTAGAKGSELATLMGLPTGRGGRVPVQPTLNLPDRPEVFVVGDLSLPEGQNPPMLAPNAIQQGSLAGKNILRLLRDEPLQPFVYRDKGSMAVIGRNAAVARSGRFAFSGFLAWVLWLGVHLNYLIGFHKRFNVLSSWAWDYFFAERSVRLILPREKPEKTDDKST